MGIILQLYAILSRDFYNNIYEVVLNGVAILFDTQHSRMKEKQKMSNKAFIGGGGGGDVSFGFCTQRGSYIFQEQ